MTCAVLSIGSNMGDRLAHLQSVVTGLRETGASIARVSPVYETDAWGGVEQGPFLNAVVIAQNPGYDGYAWLRRGQQIESAAHRIREIRWGPRSLDVDIISCRDGEVELASHDSELTLPHPLAHQRAFVLIPWLAADPSAVLTVAGRATPVADLLEMLDATERAGVRRSSAVLAV